MKIKDIFGDLPAIETKRLILRKLKLEDAPDMFEYASDPLMTKYTLWDYHKSLKDSIVFLRSVIKNYEKGEIENWGIFYKKEDKIIGTAGYFFWNIEHSNAEMQYALARAYWGKGLMTEAVRAIIKFGFQNMKLNRIEAKCMIDNVGSERVMQKAGMKFEGIIREGIFAKGKYYDVKRYAILKKDIRKRI